MQNIITNTFSLTAVQNGTDAFVFDLDNEMDAVPVDANGKVTYATTILTRARIRKGADFIREGLTLPTQASLAIPYKDSNGTNQQLLPTITNSGGIVSISWAFTTAMTLTAARYDKTVQMTYDGHTYSGAFSLLTDKSGCILQLLPSMDDIPFTRDNSNALIPASRKVYCGYTKNQNGTITTFDGTGDNQHTAIEGKYYMYYRSVQTTDNYGAWTAMTKAGITVANSDTNSAYQFCLSSASNKNNVADSNIIDKETVPIVRQNERGFGIVASVRRDNFNESDWATYAAIDHEEEWSFTAVNADGTNSGAQTSTIRNGCRVGDLFTVVGKAKDSGNGHTATYRSTTASGNLKGVCISHQISDAGGDAIVLDLDNQSDLIACHDDGKVRFARTIITKARMTKGAKQLTKTEITAPTKTAIKLAGKDADSVTVDNDGTINIQWSFATTDTLTSSNYEVQIPVTYGSVTRYAKFTLGVTNDMSIYQLVPSLNVISFSRNSSNVLTPNSIAVSCGYVKITADGTSDVSAYTKAATQGIDGKYSIYYRYINADGTTTNWTLPTTNTTITVNNNTTYAAVEYALSSASSAANVSNSNIIDRETVPVVCDGVNGTSPYFADLDNEMDSVVCNAAGATTSEQYVETNVSMFKGNTKQSLKSITCKIGGYAIDSEYDNNASSPKRYYKAVVNTTTGNVKVYVQNGTTITKTEVIITIVSTIDGADQSRDLSLTINGVKPGPDGTPATIYNLMPSVSEVNVGRTDAGGYTPQYNTLKCGYKKVVGSSPTTVEEASGTIDSKYRIFFRRRTRSTGAWDSYYYHYAHATYKRYLVVTSGYDTSGLNAATYDKVEFVLYKDTSSSTLTSLTEANIIDRETVPVVCDGLRGGEGPDGNGIASDDFYYCQTRTITPPDTTYLTESYGWYLRGSANCPTQITGKNNYLWECEWIQYTKNTSLNKKVLKLVLIRNNETQPNLLEQTAFDSEDAMDKWMYNLGSIEDVGEVIPQARGGMNAFGAFPKTTSYLDFLQQIVFNPGTLSKIVADEWYTLSFYARTRRYINVTGYTYGFYFQQIYLKAGTYKLQFNGHCSAAARSASEPVQLNGYLFNTNTQGSWISNVSTIITSQVDTTVTTGTLTVSTSGIYSIGFYAYKGQNVGGNVGETVTVNWWRIISVSDSSRLDTYLYPSAVKSGYTYFVDGIVKSNIGSDACVQWLLDEDDDCDNLGWTRHSVTFQMKSSITQVIQKVLFRAFNTYVEICMPKLEQNAMATPWCEHEGDTSNEFSHIPCGTWRIGETYYYCNGQRDVVRSQESSSGGMTWYRMKKRTTSAGYTSTVLPMNDPEHWEKANKLKFSVVDAMFAEEIFTDKLTVTKLRTTGDDSYIDMHDGQIEFYGRLGFPNIILGIDSNGCAVLKFYDKDGNYKYDLGPDSIMSEMDSMASSMVSVGELGAYDMTQSWSYARERALPSVSTSLHYRFVEGWTKTGNVKKYNVSGTSTPSSYNNKVFNSRNMTTGTAGYPTGTEIAAGYYLGKELMRPMAAQEIGSTVNLYSRRVYSVASTGAVPTLIGELCYLKGEHINDTRLADLEGNPLSCSTSHNMLYYVQNENQPTLSP